MHGQYFERLVEVESEKWAIGKGFIKDWILELKLKGICRLG